MANNNGAKKRIRKSAKIRVENRYFGKSMRNAIRKIRLVEKKAEAQKELPIVISLIDKVAKRNQIHDNKASNLKSKLTKFVNKL